MAKSLIAPPGATPLTLTEAKTALRVDHDLEDVLIEELLDAATTYLEAVTGLCLIRQTWRQFIEADNISRLNQATLLIRLEMSPVIAIEAARGFDASGNEVSLPLDSASLNDAANPPSLVLSNPSGFLSVSNGLEIDVFCGFGESGEDVPSTLKRALMVLLSHWYEFRGRVAPSDHPVSVPAGFDRLVAPYKRIRL